ncbi:MAG: hypothetical protein Q9216_005464 [Gyalolechia sp. 2 TL-2023]
MSCPTDSCGSLKKMIRIYELSTRSRPTGQDGQDHTITLTLTQPRATERTSAPPLSYTEQVTVVKYLCHPRRTPVQYPYNASPEEMVATNLQKQAGAKAAREGETESNAQLVSRALTKQKDIDSLRNTTETICE